MKWIKSITDTSDGILTPAALRRFAMRCTESDQGSRPPVSLAKAAARIRQSLAKLWPEMDPDARARLPEFLESLAGEYRALAGENKGVLPGAIGR